MSFNIKDEKTHRLARELARLTGKSMTAAVNEAIRERLERVRSMDKENRLERILRIAKECGPLWKEPYRSIDHSELLYDEKGLPK
jgi:antitoxin VapB